MNIKEILVSKYNNNKELSSSFLWRLLQVISKQGSSALMFFIATFFLSKQEMGIYNYISSALFLLVAFSDFGISTATSKYVAQYNTSQKEKVNRVLFNSGLIIFLVSIVVILLMIIFAKRLLPNYYSYLYYSLPFVLIYPLTSLIDGIYRGLKRFKTLAIVSILNGLIGVLFSYFFVTNWGLIGALLTQVCFFSTYVIALLVLNKNIEFKVDKGILKDIGSYSVYFGIASVGYFLISKVNIIILGNYNLLEEIAVYELLNKIYIIYLIPLSVLGQVLAPNIVEMFTLKRYVKVISLFKKILVYSFGLTILFIPLSILLTNMVLHIFFPGYVNEVLFALLLPVTLTYAKAIPVVVINTSMITSTGHARYMAVENVLVGILNVLLNIFVVRIYGYVGVVWVTLVLQTLSMIVLYVVYYLALLKKSKEV